MFGKEIKETAEHRDVQSVLSAMFTLVMENNRFLQQQNRELHDRLLAVYAPTVAQTLPGMPGFQVDYRGPVGVENPSHNPPPAVPVELVGTQVGTEEQE